MLRRHTVAGLAAQQEVLTDLIANLASQVQGLVDAQQPAIRASLVPLPLLFQPLPVPDSAPLSQHLLGPRASPKILANRLELPLLLADLLASDKVEHAKDARRRPRRPGVDSLSATVLNIPGPLGPAYDKPEAFCKPGPKIDLEFSNFGTRGPPPPLCGGPPQKEGCWARPVSGWRLPSAVQGRREEGHPQRRRFGSRSAPCPGLAATSPGPGPSQR